MDDYEEHVTSANDHLESAEAEIYGTSEERYHLAAAQVHATLALAAASAAPRSTRPMTIEEYRAMMQGKLGASQAGGTS